jgi:hypothetical protein
VAAATVARVSVDVAYTYTLTPDGDGDVNGDFVFGARTCLRASR